MDRSQRAEILIDRLSRQEVGRNAWFALRLGLSIVLLSLVLAVNIYWRVEYGETALECLAWRPHLQCGPLNRPYYEP